MVRQLPPWHENIGKRQVKAPKVYLRDTGILHVLLGIADKIGLLGHPKSGASWEGFALEQILRLHRGADAYFWRTHSGPELDLLLHEGQRTGYEFKMADAPDLTASMRAAVEHLHLDHLWVVYPGAKRYRLDRAASQRFRWPNWRANEPRPPIPEPDSAAASTRRQDVSKRLGRLRGGAADGPHAHVGGRFAIHGGEAPRKRLHGSGRAEHEL